MAMTDPLKNLLDKKMSRKQFIAHAGMAIVSLVGIQAAIQAITEPKGKVKKARTTEVTSHGFGSGSYGAK